MATPEDDPRLRTPWTVAQLVAVMVLITDVMYLVVCLIIAYALPWEGGYSGFVVGEGEAAPEVLGLVRIVLAGVSLPAVAAAFFMRGIVKRRPAALPTQGPMQLPDTPEGRAIPRLMTATLVSMAVAEAPAIFGLVTFLMIGGFAWLGGFLAVSFVAKIALFPRWTEIEEMIEEERLEKDL